MLVTDIVQSAAFKSGVISSFSRDDMPPDILDAGANILANEILPAINCDRTLDITVTSRVYTPEAGRIILKPLRPEHNLVLIGYSKYNAYDLVNGKWTEELDRLRPGWSTNWPVDDFGEGLTAAVWSLDTKLVAGTDSTTCVIRPENVDFPVMRVDSVMELGSRAPYTYVYRDEFEQLFNIPRGLGGVYAIEEYDDKIIVLLKGTAQPKIVVMPVPLQIINRDESHAGEIIAPPKFKKFLIDITAEQLATVYGVATLAAMHEQASASYNLLKKNHTQPLHGMNVAEHIHDLIHNRDWLEGPYLGVRVCR